MQKITVVVRKTGSLEPDYSLGFEVPTLPRVGNYLSIQRDDSPRPFGEDLIVRQVWWRMEYPSENSADSNASVGKVEEIIVECAKAIGPYSSERWRTELLQAEQLGAEVEEFDVSRPREARRQSPKQQFSRRR